MFRIDNKLYLLVTDQGYIHEPKVVWELLDEIDGYPLEQYSFFYLKIIIHSFRTFNSNKIIHTTYDHWQYHSYI